MSRPTNPRRTAGQQRRWAHHRIERVNARAERLARWLHTEHSGRFEDAPISHRSTDMDKARAFLVAEGWTERVMNDGNLAATPSEEPTHE